MTEPEQPERVMLASLAVQARTDGLHLIREQVMAAATASGAAPAVLQRLDLVLEEAVLNSAIHGYGGAGGPLEIALFSHGGGCLELTLTDSGIPFDPAAAPLPDLSASVDDRPVGGLGVHLIRTMSDRIAYCRENGTNRLTLFFLPR